MRRLLTDILTPPGPGIQSLAPYLRACRPFQSTGFRSTSDPFAAAFSVMIHRLLFAPDGNMTGRHDRCRNSGTVTATAMAKIDRSWMQGPPRDPPKAGPMLELVAVALARDSWLVAEPRVCPSRDGRVSPGLSFQPTTRSGSSLVRYGPEVAATYAAFTSQPVESNSGVLAGPRRQIP